MKTIGLCILVVFLGAPGGRCGLVGAGQSPVFQEEVNKPMPDSVTDIRNSRRKISIEVKKRVDIIVEPNEKDKEESGVQTLKKGERQLYDREEKKTGGLKYEKSLTNNSSKNYSQLQPSDESFSWSTSESTVYKVKQKSAPGNERRVPTPGTSSDTARPQDNTDSWKKVPVTNKPLDRPNSQASVSVSNIDSKEKGSNQPRRESTPGTSSPSVYGDQSKHLVASKSPKHLTSDFTNISTLEKSTDRPNVRVRTEATTATKAAQRSVGDDEGRNVVVAPRLGCEEGSQRDKKDQCREKI